MGKYITTDDIVINVRDTTSNLNTAQFIMYGESGRGDPNAENCGTAIHRDVGTGPILRVCEEADGTYPGGGKENVVNPLNFLRCIQIHDLNFSGSDDEPLNISGIVGRGIWMSVIENCGFFNMDFGIRFGSPTLNAALERSTIQDIDLDYCERNRISKCTFRNVNRQLHILAPDITVIDQNMLSGVVNTEGYIMYFAGGNDFIDIRNNIIHPILFNARTTGVPKSVRTYFSRGMRFHTNHVETVYSQLFYIQGMEVFICEGNLITGLGTPYWLADISLKDLATVIFCNNNLSLAGFGNNTFNLSVAGDDADFTKLKKITYIQENNKSTTTLGGATALSITSNLRGIYAEQGQRNKPIRWFNTYLWGDNSKHLRIWDATQGITPNENTAPIVQTSQKVFLADDLPATPVRAEMCFLGAARKPVWWDDDISKWVAANGLEAGLGNEFIIQDFASTPYSKTTLNSAYPDAIIGTVVMSQNIGLSYVKQDNNSTGNWQVFLMAPLALDDNPLIATTGKYGVVKKSAVLTAPVPTAVTKTSPDAAVAYAQADVQKMVDDITALVTQLNATEARLADLIAKQQAAGQQT